MLSYVMEFACMCLYLANLCISNAIVESLVQLIMTIDLQTIHCTTKIPIHSSVYLSVSSLLYMLCVDQVVQERVLLYAQVLRKHDQPIYMESKLHVPVILQNNKSQLLHICTYLNIKTRKCRLKTNKNYTRGIFFFINQIVLRYLNLHIGEVMTESKMSC